MAWAPQGGPAQLTIFASVLDNLRGQGTPVGRFLRERQVAEKMKNAGKALVVVHGLNISDIDG